RLARAEERLAATAATTETTRIRAQAAERRLDEVVAVLRARSPERAGAGRLVELNHVVTAGPEVTIDRISAAGSAGTCLSVPVRRGADGVVLAGAALAGVADLPVVVVRAGGGTDRGVPVAAMPAGGVPAGVAVLVCTGRGQHWGTAAYARSAPHLTVEAARWLVDAGVRLVGIDSVSVDDPAGVAHPVRALLLEAGVAVLEHLTGLEQVPAEGARLHAAPLRVRGMEVCSVRAYAALP
ncbi:MAG: cyclase family protein, partial [Dactylosporangium sp.]|nr:cyclase family protein [Dactylosporangium sp.]